MVFTGDLLLSSTKQILIPLDVCIEFWNYSVASKMVEFPIDIES